MGLFDRLRGTSEESPPPKAIVAAAMPMSGPDVRRINRGRQHQTTEQWQEQAWYFWDVTGELRAPTVWIANAASKADPYATTLDKDTGKPTGPSNNALSIAVASQVLGGPSQRAGLVRLLALCWQVAGEAWIIIRPQGAGKPDQWLVLSGQKVKAKGTSWQYTDPFTQLEITLGPTDRLIRLWCPHPNDQSKADSSVRPALPILREIERASMNIAARLDSRLAMNGILLMADELDYPRGEFETASAAAMDYLLAAAEANLQNPGQASAQVPLLINAPAEHIATEGAMRHIDLATEFDSTVVELRDNGRERLAGTLDMPKSVAEGTQNDANHWTAWQVSEDTYKIFIEPLLEAIGGPLTEEWFRPALRALGMSPEQAELEEIDWDTTSIVARPDDRETLESLYDKILISDEYMLTESGVSVDAMPNSEERTRRLLEKLVSVAPTLLADPNVASALGIEVEVQPVAAGVDAEVGANGELEVPEPEPPALPGATPDTQGDVPDESVPDGLVAAAELIVFDALSRAGGRLLTNQNRGQFKATPRHELYLSVAYGAYDMDRLLEGSFQFTDTVADTWGFKRGAFAEALSTYVGTLLARKMAHRSSLLRAHLLITPRANG